VRTRITIDELHAAEHEVGALVVRALRALTNPAPT
jgi:hypothetical protein